jgi:hypothetical protein
MQDLQQAIIDSTTADQHAMEFGVDPIQEELGADFDRDYLGPIVVDCEECEHGCPSCEGFGFVEVSRNNVTRI